MPAPESPPATLRQIAAAAGVSTMTASRALGSGKDIAPATRSRIRRIADQLGYRPDPEIAKLMHHLRTRRPRRFQSVICGLTTRPADDREEFFSRLVEGARERAGVRGYGFIVHRLDLKAGSPGSLSREFQARGIEGIMLLPQRAPIDLSELPDWSAFSTVAATTSVVAPAVHRIAPDQFANTLLLCRQLRAEGHHRIGLVLAEEEDLRVGHRFTAAVEWHARHESSAFVPPHLFTGRMTEQVVGWFGREQPDVILANEQRTIRECTRLLFGRRPPKVRFVSTSVLDEATSGIDERPGAIAAAAVDWLASLIERRIRGLPEVANTTLVAGHWVDASPGRRRRAPR
jgi:DNA-binding LacI/PurR family transcriptional regulator